MDWIYCGTKPPVGATGTQELLRSHQVIWCPHRDVLHMRRPWPDIDPVPNEKLWLVWRGADQPNVILLGGGRIWQAPRSRWETSILWIDEDHPGIRNAATSLGYRGPADMAFLHLRNVVIASDREMFPNREFADISIQSRFYDLTLEQENALQQILPID